MSLTGRTIKTKYYVTNVEFTSLVLPQDGYSSQETADKCIDDIKNINKKEAYIFVLQV